MFSFFCSGGSLEGSEYSAQRRCQENLSRLLSAHLMDTAGSTGVLEQGPPMHATPALKPCPACQAECSWPSQRLAPRFAAWCLTCVGKSLPAHRPCMQGAAALLRRFNLHDARLSCIEHAAPRAAQCLCVVYSKTQHLGASPCVEQAALRQAFPGCTRRRTRPPTSRRPRSRRRAA